MGNFLFWNLAKKPIISQVVDLCHEYEVDVLILAESVLSEVELLESLNGSGKGDFRLTANLSQ
ncbi:MAG: hypothetical protein GY765_04600 [bacterium]|nr:hypothetical protein [bacterium]